MTKSRQAGKRVAGILIAACGVCIGAGALGLFPGYSLSMDGWWNVFLILPGVLLFAACGVNVFATLATGLGVLFLLDEQGVLASGIGYRLAIPYALLVIGLAVALRRRGARALYPASGGILAGGREGRYFTVFGGNTPQLAGLFHGARGVAVFGALHFDLSGAQIRNESVLHVCTVFGAAQIDLPPDVRLLTSGVHVFGGITDEFSQTASGEADTPVLLVRTVGIFSAIRIRRTSCEV